MTDIIPQFTGDYRFLSNFHPSPIRICDVDYATVEHFYQSQKASNKDEWGVIAGAAKPGTAKALGKTCTLRPDWLHARDDIMRVGISAKFRQNASLQQMLLATGTAELIEGNTWNDTYWGVCRGKGKNVLGQIIMAERYMIQHGLAPNGGAMVAVKKWA